MSAKYATLARLLKQYLRQQLAEGDYDHFYITRLPPSPAQLHDTLLPPRTGRAASVRGLSRTSIASAPAHIAPPLPRTDQSGEAHIAAALLTPTSAPDPKPARGIAPAAPLPSPTTTQATVPASSEEFFLASECVLAEEVPRFVPPPGDRASQLRALRAFIGDCQRCPILARSRTQIVFGVGNPHAEIMFVGEAPGADEDAQGIPFVGRAGQLLTNIIEKGMGLRRADVYIANILKCRPPNNREPQPDEVANCTPFLHEQLAIVKPRVIVALGAYAARYLTGSSTPISKLRGTFHHYRDIPVMPTFHPAYLLRNYSPENRRMVWEDMKKVLAYVRG